MNIFGKIAKSIYPVIKKNWGKTNRKGKVFHQTVKGEFLDLWFTWFCLMSNKPVFDWCGSSAYYHAWFFVLLTDKN